MTTLSQTNMRAIFQRWLPPAAQSRDILQYVQLHDDLICEVSRHIGYMVAEDMYSAVFLRKRYTRYLGTQWHACPCYYFITYRPDRIWEYLDGVKMLETNPLLQPEQQVVIV